MAIIDKIYGTKAQRDEFFNWCKINLPSALQYFYKWEDQWDPQKEHPITNFPTSIDIYLYHYCPIEFVKNRLLEQYSLFYFEELAQRNQ